MKAQDSDQSDERLRRVLREWEVKTELPPLFEDGVWRRIEHQQAQRPDWLSRWRRVGEALVRPSVTVSYLAVLILAGVLAGYWQARVATTHAEETLSARYVQLVDPYQNMKH